MLNALSIMQDVLMVYGRLKLGKLGFLGAISATVLFAGLVIAMIFGWIWNLLVGAALVPGHDILGGDLDASVVVVMPITWIAGQISRGRLFLSRAAAESRQQRWHDKHWQIWNATGQFSLSAINFVMVMFGAATLLCLCAAIVVGIMPVR